MTHSLDIVVVVHIVVRRLSKGCGTQCIVVTKKVMRPQLAIDRDGGRELCCE